MSTVVYKLDLVLVNSLDDAVQDIPREHSPGDEVHSSGLQPAHSGVGHTIGFLGRDSTSGQLDMPGSEAFTEGSSSADACMRHAAHESGSAGVRTLP